MNYVSTFEEACAKLDISTKLPLVSTFPESLQKNITATYKLATIIEVNNGGWKPDIIDPCQWRYYPVFKAVKESGSSGYGISYIGYGCDCPNAFSFCGSHLACKDEKLAEFMGTTFLELYKDLYA